MLAVCSVYLLHPSPLWLHVISVVAVVMGAVHALRIVQRLGAGGIVASAAALAFVLNDNTARTLNYGFHPEILYAWFVPWMIDAGLRGARKSFIAAMLACMLIKEDACLPIFATGVALGLTRARAMSWSDRMLFLALPTIIAVANLIVYHNYVLPLLTGATYAHFWWNYGDTHLSALASMSRQPIRVLHSTLTSGVGRVLQPHLFLPVLGWRWALGVVPIVVLYGASANEQLRAFGIYYAIVLVPFLVISAAAAASAVAHRLVRRPGHAQLLAGGTILFAALLVGSDSRGYSLRPWRSETANVREALAGLADEPVVLVQSGLFPHAGYDARVELLTPETLNDPRRAGAAILLAHGISAYPFTQADLDGLLRQPQIRSMPSHLVAVRPPRMAAHRAGAPTGIGGSVRRKGWLPEAP
jgi:hypothetical protein